jgi:hypothetical protein
MKIRTDSLYHKSGRWRPLQMPAHWESAGVGLRRGLGGGLVRLSLDCDSRCDRKRSAGHRSRLASRGHLGREAAFGWLEAPRCDRKTVRLKVDLADAHGHGSGSRP